MKDLITNFPSDLEAALKIAKNTPLTKVYPNFSSIVICGLGGSGIGGKLVAGWCEKDLEIPVVFCQDYIIPSFTNNKTLVIACSYSGNTEETLIATEAAHHSGASIIAVTSGGKLAEFCVNHNYECILIPGGKPPRTQLAFSIVQITHILVELRLVKATILDDFKSASEILTIQQVQIKQQAKKLADFIYNKHLIIYSDSKNEAIAIRARQQFNENSKILCSHHVIPEMNHNELVGWAGGTAEHAVLLLHTGNVHPQNEKRFEFSKSVIETKTQHIYEMQAKGESTIVRSLYLINVIDWASWYLAELKQVDAVEIGVIVNLKNSLV